ncbi:MAG: hypothetical protein ACK5D5_10625 [Bacteroidota bacterium]|jgi:hypothetical protein
MEKESIKKYFSLNELKRLNELEGKILKNIIYFVWINKTVENNPYVFIDKLKLQTQDDLELTLSASEESDRIFFDDQFDFELQSIKFKNEFEGKIILKEYNANNDKFWKDITGNEIRSVQLSKDGNEYLADALILDFGAEKRLIGVSPEEGLIIDYHEEI